jgi:exopolysaccharide biosynthesis polyprenyl glycosylphosphotransferase
MLKEHSKLVSRLVMVTDLTLIAVAFYLSYLLRSSSVFVQLFGRIGPFARYEGMLFITLPIAYFVFKYTGLYTSQRLLSFGRVLWVVCRALLLVAVIFAASIFFLKAKFFSRSLYIFFFWFALVLISLEKVAIRYAQQQIRRRGFNYRNCLLVGTEDQLQRFVDRLSQHEEWGLRIVGFVAVGAKPAGQPDLGRWDDLPTILREHIIDEVVFALPYEHMADLERHIQECEEVGVNARIVADFIRPSRANMTIDDVDGLPLVTYATTPQDTLTLSVKRGLDIIAGTFGLLCLSPLFLMTAVAIALTSPGPVFFKQQRIGKNGRIFTLFKFRSMYEDAEDRRKDLERLNEMRGPVFKMKDDPRITAVGRFIRKSSLDEAPQFWNVLKGDMSLVGPRPPLPQEVKQYNGWQRRRLSMKPDLFLADTGKK